jgi:hypothetical protein
VPVTRGAPSKSRDTLLPRSGTFLAVRETEEASMKTKTSSAEPRVVEDNATSETGREGEAPQPEKQRKVLVIRTGVRAGEWNDDWLAPK